MTREKRFFAMRLPKNTKTLASTSGASTTCNAAPAVCANAPATDVKLDVDLMRRMQEICSPRFVTNVTPAEQRPGPIFVLGLPRSGTTLVDRILSSHVDVQSMGEITDFAMTLNRIAQTMDRQQLLEALPRLDPDQIGINYLSSVRSYGVETTNFVDKTLVNFLYIGFIMKALPGAVGRPRTAPIRLTVVCRCIVRCFAAATHIPTPWTISPSTTLPTTS